VLNVLSVSAPSTFFAAVTLIDRYLIAKHVSKQSLGPDSLYLIGLTAILMASKLEDVQTITMSVLLEKAAHGRFTRQQLRDMEFDMLQSLKFRTLARTSLYYEAGTLFKASLARAYLASSHMKATLDEAEQYLTFLCILGTYSLPLLQAPMEEMASAVVQMTLKYTKN
jgi:Cyclin, N-terminal domain